MANENREIKSSLFADLFADDEFVGKKNFLSLYNAIHGTDLKLEDTVLERKTIPQNISKSCLKSRALSFMFFIMGKISFLKSRP